LNGLSKSSGLKLGLAPLTGVVRHFSEGRENF